MEIRIRFYNRYTGKIETETMCGEWFTGPAYGTGKKPYGALTGRF
jgi:hypothetical protein